MLISIFNKYKFFGNMDILNIFYSNFKLENKIFNYFYDIYFNDFYFLNITVEKLKLIKGYRYINTFFDKY